MPYLSDRALAAALAGQNVPVTLRRGKYRPAPKRRMTRPSPASVQAIRKASGEKKGVDTTIGEGLTLLATTTTADGIIPLNLIRAGAGSSNRVGRKVFCKSVRLRGTVYFNQEPEATTKNLDPNVMRMVLVWDKQPSGALPIFSDIFAATFQSGTDAASVESLPRFDNMNRFQILRDIRIVAQPLPAANDGTENEMIQAQVFDEYVKLGNRQTIYGADTSPAVIGDISSGGLYVVLRAHFQTAGVNTVILSTNSTARLRYSD